MYIPFHIKDVLKQWEKRLAYMQHVAYAVDTSESIFALYHDESYVSPEAQLSSSPIWLQGFTMATLKAGEPRWEAAGQV